MSDFLIRLGENKAASAVVRSLGLSLPQTLRRQEGPWKAQCLAGRAVIVGAGPRAELLPAAVDACKRTGAITHVLDDSGQGVPDEMRAHGLVFDATGLRDGKNLDSLYQFFHAQVRGIATCGRAIVLVRTPSEAQDPVTRAARRAVEGFVKSLAKEIGRKGATAQLIYIDAGADDRVEGVLRFLLSDASAYISGQPLHVSSAASFQAAAFEQALAGKVALVTGAARGIGEATAHALAREGATLIVMDRPADLEAAQAVATAIGGSALGCDITDEDASARICAHAEHHHGGLDIVVHNAGITRDKMLANMDEARWRQVLDVNLLALIRTNEELVDALRDGGRVICLSSIGGIAGNVGQTNYGATKAGVIGYVQGLAPRVAARGITVNAVAPGFIETRLTAAIPLATREVARRLCNLSQGGLPQDIAEAITFLASPDACGMSGEVLRVCGGNFIGA